jgi:general secretion pathway protein D
MPISATRQRGRGVLPLAATALCLLALASCADPTPRDEALAGPEWLQEGRPHLDRQSLETANAGLATYADPSKPIMSKLKPPNSGVVDSVRFSGNDRGSDLISDSSSGADDDGAGGERRDVEIEFVNNSLRSVIDFVFTEYLDRPYTVLPDFADKQVNWLVSGSYTTTEVLRMFESFLQVHDVYVEEKGGLYTISASPVSGGQSDALIGQKTAMWRLDHLDAKQIVPIVRQFVRNGDRVQVLDSINTLVVTASAAETQQVDTFLQSVDVPVFEGKEVILYSPAYLSPQSLVALLQTLPKKMAGQGGGGGRTVIDADVIQDRNMVVIVLEHGQLRDEVMRFVARVDQPDGEQPQLFYYTLKNQKANEVRQTLTTILPGLLNGTESVKVAAHDATNSLLITAAPAYFYEIKKVIDRLDFTVPSVMIDAAIVEVQLRDDMQYGVEWFLDERMGDYAVDVATDLGQSISGGVELGILSLTDNTFGVLQLLETETSLNVLSRPRVIVKNNEEADFETVDEVKVISSVESSDLNQGGTTGFVRNFETKQFGIKLKVTPIISDDGTIDMTIEIEDSRRGGTQTLAGEQLPTFNTRRLKTRVLANSAETIFIGGLIKKSNDKSSEKVPFFADLPLIGKAFQNKDDQEEKTELVIFLTPYIMFDKMAARLISDAVLDSTLSSSEPAM